MLKIRRPLFLCIALLSAPAFIFPQQAPINCSGPLKEAGLIGLLKVGVEDARVQAIVNKCGVDFALNTDVEQRLRAAKASDGLIAVLRAIEKQRQQREEEDRQRRAAEAEAQRQAQAIRSALETKKQEEERLWAGAQDGRSAERLGEYLRQFPDGQHASDARDKMNKLKRAEELRVKIRQTRDGGQWRDAEGWVKELEGLLPEDEEMRSWKTWVLGERAHWDSMTLAEATEEMSSLEKKVEELRKAVEAARDVELKQQEGKYQAEREKAGQVAPQKDMFETSAEYEKRVAKWKESLGDLESKYKLERGGIEKRYATEMERQSQGYRRQMEELKARTFVVGGAKVEFVTYDADHSLLTVKVSGEEYWFRIEPQSARSLVERLRTAKVEQILGEEHAYERVLYDSTAGQRYTGVLRSAEEDRLRREAELAEQEKQTELARISWIDPKTRLMWARQDNGSDVNWSEAVSYCQQLRLGGFSDWRLPEIGELQGIFDASVNELYKVKGNIQLSNYWVWSATRQGSGEAWIFFFTNGERHHGQLDSRSLRRALCVRRSGE
jgi:hypothetical protein